MKQKAILQFMGTVKTKFIPSKRRPSHHHHQNSSHPTPSSSTWLLVDASSPSYSSKSLAFQSSRVSPSSTSSSSAPAHPAMSSSYRDYYKNLGRSLGITKTSEDMNSMENFSSSPSPPSLLSHPSASLSLAPAPLSPDNNSPSHSSSIN